MRVRPVTSSSGIPMHSASGGFVGGASHDLKRRDFGGDAPLMPIALQNQHASLSWLTVHGVINRTLACFLCFQCPDLDQWIARRNAFDGRDSALFSNCCNDKLPVV
jgi:hypothetical protein